MYLFIAKSQITGVTHTNADSAFFFIQTKDFNETINLPWKSFGVCLSNKAHTVVAIYQEVEGIV